MMHSRITFALASAAGGLGGAFLPVAVAYADDISTDPAAYSYDLDGKETITGLYNMTTAPPGINESVQGYGVFNAVDSSGNPVGTFDAYSSTAPYLTPYLPDANSAIVSSQVLYVDSDIPGGKAGDLPDGSIISVTHSGGGLFEAVYSAIPGAPGADDTVSETLITPFGTYDLTPIVTGLGFDAANVTPQLPAGITADGDPDITAVNGLPPLTIAEQGYQTLISDGQNFNVVETTTEDGLGYHTEAFLVTNGLDSNVPTGTVYNVINYGGLSNVYSSTPQLDGTDKVSDILYSSSGKEIADLSSLFASDDASKGLLDGSNLQDIKFGDTTISPDGTETFTGVNGLPPGNESVQGIDTFLYNDGTDPATSFQGDVTTIPNMSFSNYSEAILVTDSTNTDILPNGSVFDLTTYGNGWENIYTDIPGAGTSHDVITDTLVSPFGNEINLSPFYQTIDASAGMSGAHPIANFLDDAWLALFPAQGADLGGSAADAVTNIAPDLGAHAGDAAASVAPELGGHFAEMLTNLWTGLF